MCKFNCGATAGNSVKYCPVMRRHVLVEWVETDVGSLLTYSVDAACSRWRICHARSAINLLNYDDIE